MKTEVKKLYLSSTDKKIAGVCGGLAEWFEVDSTVVRLTWIILDVITGIAPMIFAYIIAFAVMPERPPVVKAESQEEKEGSDIK